MLFLVAFYGCTEDFNDEVNMSPTLVPRYLAVNPTEMTFSSSPEKQQLNITSTETPWKINNGIEWISLSSISGSASADVSVSTIENTIGDEARAGIFYLRADVVDWNFEQLIAVTQSGAAPIISLSKTEVEFTGSTNTETITVTSNCTWSITSSAEWLTATQNDKTITLAVTSNETDSYRTATVSVNHTGNRNTSKTVIVRQAPASVNASSDSLVFNNTAGSVTITINSEASWKASTASSWIELSATEGNAGESSLKINVSPNPSTSERTGYVIISIGNKQRIQIPIRQRGIYIESEQTELSFKSAGETIELSILSNTSWTVSSHPSWITVTPENGEGNNIIKVTALDNPNTTTRTGAIHVTQNGLNIDVTVNVEQEGKYFSVNTAQISFDDKEDCQNIEIETDGNWSAQSNTDWITVSPLSSAGKSTLTVSVTENTSTEERTGKIVITVGDKSETITVVQKGKYFTVDNSLLTYSSKGGSLEITITTNDTWTASVEKNPSWLILSKTSGSGDIKIKATANDNPSVNSRTSTIVLNTIHNQSVRIVVTQDARYLRIDNNEVLFYSKGGTSEAITVSTDGSFKITCSDTWFSVTQSNNTFTVTASENETVDARIGTITIELTDLTEGSYSLKLTVTQLNYGGTFLRKDYDDDVNYDNMGNSTGSLTITGFGEDKDYDTSTTSGTTLSVTDFKSDSNWDANASSGVTVSVTGFKTDNSYDTTTSSSGSISKTSFEDDVNWK